ncbi:MAG: ABC transporter permease [Wenzhouxiangellaceae bacterium]
MITYELRLAAMSFRKNPILTSLMVAAVALGIGVCMTTLTLYYLMSDNPIPHKSDQLFAVQLDSWDPNNGYGNSDEDYPEQLTWNDAQNLLHQSPDYPQVSMFKTAMVIETDNVEQPPSRERGRVTSRDFFSMFDIGFKYGDVWSQNMEDAAQQVVVLSDKLNETLFGGENSTGRMLRLDDELYEIVGVLEHWQPAITFYDVNNGAFDEPEDFYLPLTLAPVLEINNYGNTNCWKDVEGEGYSAFLNSECIWTQYWVELPDEAAVAEYQGFLEAYFMEQKAMGRFGRPMGVRLSNVEEWLDLNNVVGNDSRVLLGLAFMFLAVCVFNTIGLLLTKFLGRANETGLRRALGATRAMIFRQHLVEVGSIGLVGGMIGIGLAWIGLRGVDRVANLPDAIVQLNTELVLIAVSIAVGATLLAGLYPSWHIGRIAPARYLKT